MQPSKEDIEECRNPTRKRVAWYAACASRAPKMHISEDSNKRVEAESTHSQPKLQTHVQAKPWEHWDQITENKLQEMYQNAQYQGITVQATQLQPAENALLIGDEVPGAQAFFTSGRDKDPDLATWVNVDKTVRDKLGRKAPDACLAAQRHEDVALLFEMKTPWMHDLTPLGNIAKGCADVRDKRKSQQLLGQIVHYLLKTNLRYGCLSTYKQSVFVKLEDGNEGLDIFVSPVVSSETDQLSQSIEDVKHTNHNIHSTKLLSYGVLIVRSMALTTTVFREAKSTLKVLSSCLRANPKKQKNSEHIG